jgi:hypothetical protein
VQSLFSSARNPAERVLHYSMPSLQEFLGILIVVLVLWFVLKMARVAIRLMVFLIGLAALFGVLYFVFVR